MSSTMDTPRDPSDIERQSDVIRADMSATLNALERKLSPQQLVDRSLNMVKDHGGEFVTNLGSVAKENPVPLLLTAVGLVWLIAANARGSSTSSNRYRSGLGEYGTDDYGYEEMGLSGTESSGLGSTTYGSDYASTGEGQGKMQGIKQRVQETASHLKDRVQQTTNAARERLRSSRDRLHSTGESFDEARGDAANRVRNLSQQTKSQAIHARDSFTTMLNEQPLAVGALGVVIGAIVGAALPATQAEDRMLGNARDQALERAKRMGKEQYNTLRQRANDMADDVANRARRAVSNNGGSSSQGESSGTQAGMTTDPSSEARGTSGSSMESGSFKGESRPVGRA